VVAVLVCVAHIYLLRDADVSSWAASSHLEQRLDACVAVPMASCKHRVLGSSQCICKLQATATQGGARQQHACMVPRRLAQQRAACALVKPMLCLLQSGLKKQDMIDVIALGAIAAPMYALKGPAMAKQTYPTAFPLKHQQKDMRLALALGDEVGKLVLCVEVQQPVCLCCRFVLPEVWHAVM
jgi:hypothetical protein